MSGLKLDLKYKRFKHYESDKSSFVRITKKLTRISRAKGGRSSQLPRYMRTQKSIIKISYKKNSKDGSWAAHGRYLSRQSAQKKAEIVKAFSKDSEIENLPSILSSWERAGDPYLFKLVISPERSKSIDLQAHTKLLMEKTSLEVGEKLQWYGIIHDDADSPHAHVVLRGVNECGKRIRLPKDFIRFGLRQVSEEKITSELGLRTKGELVEERTKEITALRLTTLDKRIIFRSKNGIVDYSNINASSNSDYRAQIEAELLRLGFLKAAGLVKIVGDRKFFIPDSLKSSLREKSIQQDIVKTKAKQRGG